MHIGRTGMFNIIKKKWETWSVKENGSLVNDLRRRGVEDAEALPGYHYRDDALLLWNAIQTYVAKIVENVYGESFFAECPFFAHYSARIKSLHTEE